MSLKDLVNGKEVSHKKGRLLVVEKSLDELETNSIISYLKGNMDSLYLDRIREAFPELGKVSKREMLFFDIETRGFSYNSPIIAVGMTHLNHKISTSCLFARDYSEEKSILEYFVDKVLPEYHTFFTYNGLSFDLTRLDRRMQANGILCPFPKYRTLKESLVSSHIDLRQELARMNGLHLPDLKLQTIEKVVFGMSRSRDTPSRDIPRTYADYINGDDGDEQMALAINHTITDTLTLPAILAFICNKRVRKRKK